MRQRGCFGLQKDGSDPGSSCKQICFRQPREREGALRTLCLHRPRLKLCRSWEKPRGVTPFPCGKPRRARRSQPRQRGEARTIAWEIYANKRKSLEKACHSISDSRKSTDAIVLMLNYFARYARGAALLGVTADFEPARLCRSV